jgi:hypothetical protein
LLIKGFRSSVKQADGVSNVKYNAFLSYSHSDAKLAERISQRLRRYRPQRKSKVARRRLMVFRDVERLTAAADLQATLEERVRDSGFLVLLGSPDAARSSYVELESRTFLDRWGPKAVVVVLCRGEIEDALPPSIAGVAGNLLYIDLRKPGRRNFRLETLRLIAALFGIEYSELRREDGERRRRLRNSVVLAALVSAALLASAYVILVTPSEGWQAIKQPETRMATNALAPVEVFAVNRIDPSAVAWLARNARHVRDLDESSAFVWRPDRMPDGFDQRVKERLAKLAGSPVASLDLSIGKEGEPGELDVEIFAFRRRDKSLSFARRGSIKAPQGRPVPLPLTEKEYDPFDLEPEIASALLKLRLGWAAIHGTLIDHTDGDKHFRVEFQREDTRDDMREVLDAVSSPEYLLFSNNPAWNRRFSEAQEDLGAWDTWQTQVIGSGGWLPYEIPNSKSITLHADDLGPAADIAARIAAASREGVEPDLARAIFTGIESTDFYAVRLLSRQETSVAVAQPIRDNHEIVQQPAPRRLFRIRAAEPWQPLRLPASALSEVLDVIPVNASSATALAITKGEGLFRTTDAGASWQSINLGRDAFVRAEQIKVIVAPGPTVYALAILSTQPDGDLNPLFMLRHRSWPDRWRLGLADLLRGESRE